ncbi:hypothetical protein BDV96DRAFT_646048 [Lophiotrema nucula]|uniref:BZIP domain-containing protein n=1 Tax=Lophiotrema nucula TaxID=690887 RepID=A0A6A5ZBR5_9PLEO|nr:hypothetical protein BDV96DRAFT_646048 [Lophiotrema nucula]
MISAHQLTPPPTVDPSNTTTIKMEDLAVPYGTPSQLPPTSHPSESTPPPSDSRHPKKRKSWGQVLPEPKTNLPPRKRAKTEDEKEQRRIERVKRNRLAAHNSRERKRQEYEILQNEKDQLELDLHEAQRAMARMAAELKAFRQKYPSESFTGVASSNSSSIDDYDSIIRQSDSHTICPRQTHAFPSPVSMDSMDSPRDDSCAPDTPAYTESVATDFDQTRYPAAIFDISFPYTLQSHTQHAVDEKPLDSLFDFDQFPENHVESVSGLVDHNDFFAGHIFHDTHANPYGLSDNFGARHFDLQTDSGAAYNASDEALAAEV